MLLADILTGQPDLSKSAKKAYESTLKKYHGWMVQGIFSVSFVLNGYDKCYFHCFQVYHAIYGNQFDAQLNTSYKVLIVRDC